jgi:hypothetical protein
MESNSLTRKTRKQFLKMTTIMEVVGIMLKIRFDIKAKIESCALSIDEFQGLILSTNDAE